MVVGREVAPGRSTRRVGTAPNIASLVGDSIPLTSPTSTWATSMPAEATGPASAAPGPATQLHLLSMRATQPDGTVARPRYTVPSDPKSVPAGPEHKTRPRRRRGLRPVEEKHELPESIGPYQLGRRLARGGMSQVVEAWDMDRRKTVALKVMRPAGPGRRAEREAWDREIAILRSIKHPGVVPLLDYGIGEGGELYLAMPLLSGHSARGELVATRRAGTAALVATTYDVLLPAFLDICDTLVHVHEMGVLHCDLKPGNIFLPRSHDRNKGLLLDWGVSVVGAGSRQRGEGGRPGGTPGYMAPEQITGRIGDLDARTDVYGLGCLLYEFITWSPAIRRGDPRRALKDGLRGNIVDAHVRAKDLAVPEQLSGICMKALSLVPADRYASPGDLAAALRGLLKT